MPVSVIYAVFMFYNMFFLSMHIAFMSVQFLIKLNVKIC